MRRPNLTILIAFFALLPTVAQAEWKSNGVGLATAPADQVEPTIVSDGAGGAIVAWYDYRNGASDIYAQRIDAAGVPLWPPDGVAVCAVAGYQEVPAIVSDGAGGAIVAWQDHRSGNVDIYAQRIDAFGALLWPASGVAVCTAAGHQYYPEITTDGVGGAIVAWQDDRGGASDVYARRIDAAGVVQWTADGVVLCAAVNFQSYPTIASDGSGGAIVTWYDNRSGPNFDIYAQRVDGSGVVQWTADGAALCTAGFNQIFPMIVADGAGGAIVTWYDYRNGANSDIYAQRINILGVVQWTFDGVPLCAAANGQQYPTITSDGAEGAIVTWEDERGAGGDIYAQRVGASGAVQWTFDGVALCTAAGEQRSPTVVSDGVGGAIVTWLDSRSGTRTDIYAQRIDASGEVQWTPDGTPLCTAANGRANPLIVSNGVGGGIVTWYDSRGGFNTDIYAQRVEGVYGYWGHPEPIVLSVSDIPADQGGKVAVNWRASGRDRPVPRTIGHYSVWRVVPTASATASGAPVPVTDLRDVGPDATGPLYTVVPGPPGPNFTLALEFVGAQSAHGWPGYAYSASTRADSVAGNASNEIYFVAAHDKDDDYVAFLSTNFAVGHSVDNLAPAAPLMLTAQRVGADVRLVWNRVRVPDLRDYSVYRATASGVTPAPVNFLASAGDTVLVDANAPVTALYYIVTAHDVHQNQSAPSNEASVSPTTGIGETPKIGALTLRPNHPNPFAEWTVLEIGLPADSRVSIEVYDVAGRRVRAIALPVQKAGWQPVAFDGRDDRGRTLASGVYFYRVRANGTTITRKMVIAR